VGNERALLYEMTESEATGQLKAFLQRAAVRTNIKQLKKFTEMGPNGTRSFIYSDETRLERVSPSVEAEFARVWNEMGYGATLMKVGWKQRGWSDNYFRILDISKRLESGDGSYGLARYYVLIAADENLLAPGDVILDVKQTVAPAMLEVLPPSEGAWYGNLFVSEAARAVEAQRHLTSFTDPFTGWVRLFGKDFVIRQRSPWKASFDYSSLDSASEFMSFAEQVAVVTATSHARGTVGQSPSQFKEVITQVLGAKRPRDAWAESVTQIAARYREQVLSDYTCFKAMVDRDYGA